MKSAPAPAESSEAASGRPAGDEIQGRHGTKTLSNLFWVDMADGIQAEAEKLGVTADIFAVDAETDIDGQLKKCEDAINSGSYDGLGVAPITATNLISAVVAANQKGMPVVNIDAKIDEDALKEAGGYVVGFATSDNHKVGAMALSISWNSFPTAARSPSSRAAPATCPASFAATAAKRRWRPTVPASIRLSDAAGDFGIARRSMSPPTSSQKRLT